MKRITIAVAEDNTQFAEQLSSLIRADERLELSGLAGDGEEICSIIEEKKPDVVSLDIIMPKLDGLSVMDRMLLDKRKETGYYQPSFVIVSAVTNDFIQQEAFAHGAAYFIQKPVDPRLVVERLITIHKHQADRHILQAATVCEMPARYMQGDPVSDVSRILHDLGMTANLKGYHYFRDGILMAIQDPDRLNGITKNIYDEIAIKRHTTSGRVERAMRHAIDVSWSKGKMPLLNRMYGFGSHIVEEKPTAARFIATISDKLSMDYKNSLSKN